MQLFGQVTDADTGASIPGATVGIYQEQQPHCIQQPCGTITMLIDGTSTDAAGYYSTEIPAGAYAKISAIGYQPQQIAATSGQGYVKLKKATYAIDGEAVVTASKGWPTWAKLAIVAIVVGGLLWGLNYVLNK